MSNEETNKHIMTLDEMRTHEWIVSWSGGKDSTATIILMHEYNIPIKKIVYVRMMFDKNTPATLPIMSDFINRAAKQFKQWNYTVEIIPSIQTALEVANTKYKRSKTIERNGKFWGITAFMRGQCRFMNVKANTVKRYLSNQDDYEMIGYAADEINRIQRLGNKRQSIMLALNVKTPAAFCLCRKHNLLSPIYNTGIKRDGCFFCPNATSKERELIQNMYPEYIKKIEKMINMSDYPIYSLKNRNNWLKEYFKTHESK